MSDLPPYITSRNGYLEMNWFRFAIHIWTLFSFMLAISLVTCALLWGPQHAPWWIIFGQPLIFAFGLAPTIAIQARRRIRTSRTPDLQPKTA